jgi:hypothetical protein
MLLALKAATETINLNQMAKPNRPRSFGRPHFPGIGKLFRFSGSSQRCRRALARGDHLRDGIEVTGPHLALMSGCGVTICLGVKFRFL